MGSIELAIHSLFKVGRPKGMSREVRRIRHQWVVVVAASPVYLPVSPSSNGRLKIAVLICSLPQPLLTLNGVPTFAITQPMPGHRVIVPINQ
jgi:hypothetical protein